MAEEENFGENVFMKKYLALRNKCEHIQQGNERLVNRLQHVKKLVRTYNRQRKFLQRRLDGYKDNYWDAQVPVMWEEDHMYNLLKPRPDPSEMPVPQTVTVSPAVKQKQPRKHKSLLKSHDKSPANQASASGSHGLMMSPSSHQSEAVFARLADSDSPIKRPTSAFMMFCDQYKLSIQNEFMREKKTPISQAELTKRLTLKWNSLAAEDKKIYQDMMDIQHRNRKVDLGSSYLDQSADNMYIEADAAVSSLLAGHGEI
ncbi:TCF3 fusion partner homolog [Mya arenaria]|uniref:TCF3 fusion partner homolog n=1 Tax=Mya arenaria TaxID=6604 RepID=UPI0022E72B3C|nr:TCF3 fusion partner homolog [Mya arenaria]